MTLALLISATLLAHAPSGPTLALEDTMVTEIPEVLVRAPRVTLGEILDRVARGEARRDSSLADQAFTATSRVVRDVHGKGGPKLLEETVVRVYRKRPGRSRVVLLRHWKAKPDKRGAKVAVEVSPDMSERIVNFAFRAEARRDYRYRIVGRDLVGGHVIYRIAFAPRSTIGFEPRGLVWVDTNEFVIVREEIEFARSPVPLVLEEIERMVVERQRVDGYWVLKRVLIRLRMTIPLPSIGRGFDLALHFDDYQLNTGLDDAFFETKVGRRAVRAPGGGR